MTDARLKEERNRLDKRLQFISGEWTLAAILAILLGTVAMICCLCRSHYAQNFCVAALGALILWGFLNFWYRLNIKRWLAIVDQLIARRKF